MARSRLLKPEFFTDERLGDLEPLTRLLFAGLWTIADREGRLEDRPRRIRAEVLPYDDCDVEPMLAALAAAGFIERYEAEGGRYIAIPGFARHQRPHSREVESAIPAPASLENDEGTTKVMPRHNLGDASARPRLPDPVSISVSDPVSVSDPEAVTGDGGAARDAPASKHRPSRNEEHEPEQRPLAGMLASVRGQAPVEPWDAVLEALRGQLLPANYRLLEGSRCRDPDGRRLLVELPAQDVRWANKSLRPMATMAACEQLGREVEVLFVAEGGAEEVA